MGRYWSSRPSTSCFPGCVTCSPTASTTVPTWLTPWSSSVTGPLRSSNAPLMLRASNCCHAAGWSNEPSLGSIETAAWRRISKHRSPAPERGSTLPRCSYSLGDWRDQRTTYLRYITTIPIQIQTLTAGYKSEVYEESDGHPYIIKVLLGEIAKARALKNVERIVAGKDEIL